MSIWLAHSVNRRLKTEGRQQARESRGAASVLERVSPDPCDGCGSEELEEVSCESTFVEYPVPAVPLPAVSPAPRLNAAWEPTPGRARQPPSGKDISGRGVRSWHTTSSSGCGAQHSIDVRDDGGGTGMTVDSGGACLYNPCGAMVELADCRWSHGPSIQARCRQNIGPQD